MESSASLSRIPTSRFLEFEQLWWEEQQRLASVGDDQDESGASMLVGDPSFFCISGESDSCKSFIDSLMDCSKAGRRPKITLTGKATLQYLLDVSNEVSFSKEYLLEARDPKGLIYVIKKKWQVPFPFHLFDYHM